MYILMTVSSETYCSNTNEKNQGYATRCNPPLGYVESIKK